MTKIVEVYLHLTFNLHYLLLFTLIFSHIKKNVYEHFTRQELEQRILYRRYTEQFKLHFTDIHKSKIEY